MANLLDDYTANLQLELQTAQTELERLQMAAAANHEKYLETLGALTELTNTARGVYFAAQYTQDDESMALPMAQYTALGDALMLYGAVSPDRGQTNGKS